MEGLRFQGFKVLRSGYWILGFTQTEHPKLQTGEATKVIE